MLSQINLLSFQFPHFYKFYYILLSMHYSLYSVGVLATLMVANALPTNVFPLRSRRALSPKQGLHRGIAPLLSTEFSEVVDIEVIFGDQSFLVEVDLGSSDLWVVGTGYQCISPNDNSILPQAVCNYGNRTYDFSSTFEKIDGQNFGVYYGAGIAVGTIGYETINVGGITIPHQEVGIVSSATNQGDGFNSGIMGLGYPAITSAHPGETIDNTTLLYNRIPYNPVVFNMASAGLIEPFFSLAIDRTPFGVENGPGGLFGLGEVPPVDHSDEWACSPVVILPQIPINATANKSQYAYWALEVTSVVYGGRANLSANDYEKVPHHSSLLTTNATSFNAVLDNGNPLSFLPRTVASSINAQFFPPATPPPEGSYLWAVACNATVPYFGVEIDGKMFWHDGQDMIFDLGDGNCISSIASAEDVSLHGVTANFLGLQFFKNVLAVFDFGVNEIRLASRL
jgi:hypothetical protein